MRKSNKREYAYHRRYDWDEENTPRAKRFVKRRSHKRLRALLNPKANYVRKPI